MGLDLSEGTLEKILSTSGLQLPPSETAEGLPPGWQERAYLVVVSLLLGHCFHGQGSQAEVMLQKQGVDILEWHLALGWSTGLAQELNG